MTSLIIGGTITIIVLMWLFKDSDAVKTVLDSISKLYTDSVGALSPK